MNSFSDSRIALVFLMNNHYGINVTHFSRKELFRYYLYGYQNEKMVGRWKTGNQKNRKEFKKKAIVSYLNLGRFPSFFQKTLIAAISIAELPLSWGMETFLFVRYVFALLFHTKSNTEGNIFFIGTKEQRFKKELQNARIPEQEVMVVKFYGWNYGQIFDGIKQISILEGLRLSDVWRAYRYSLRMSAFMNKRYGKEDMFFRSYSSFEFFLACFFLSQLDKSKTVVFVETYSRWAHLCGRLSHHVVFVQHGIIGKDLNFLIKIGSPDEAYFLNEKEATYCCEYMFNRKPEIKFLDGLKFTSNEKLLDNGNINVLVVCHYIYFEIEKRIASTVIGLGGYNVYMKPHPLDPREQYVEFCKEIGAIIIDKQDYPKVDVVIAYNSTLAVEYMDAGVDVIRHDEIDFEEIINKVKQYR